jgi:flagellar hook assembly protein FlgD
LSQNYPNPFNPATSIEFSLGRSGYTSLKVYNILGQEVKTIVNGQWTAGFHRVTWDGKDHRGLAVSSGIYFYRLQSNGIIETKKMLLMK